MNRTPVLSFPWEAPPVANPESALTQRGRFVFPCVINEGVEDSALLPCPDDYQIPTSGEAGAAISRIAAGLIRKRSVYLWGPPGAGKDAVFAAYSQTTRTPALLKQIIPGTDIRSWLYSRAITQGGTTWEEGELLKALRDGYTTMDGNRIPYLIVLTDLDRADPQQVEVLRLILDTTKGRIEGPAGRIYDVLPGTQIVATANTSGGGDATGRMTSSRVMDSSIKSRFDLVVRLQYMDWAEEEKIHRKRRTWLTSRIDQQAWAKVGRVVQTLRQANQRGEINVEMGLREVQRWLSHAEDLLVLGSTTATDMRCLRMGALCLLDDCAGEEERQAMAEMIKPLIGAVG